MKTINKKLILIVGILILVIGISFAYFVGSTMFGGVGSNVEGTTATIYGSTLRVDGTINIEESDIYPGYRDISAIKVTTTGNNETVAYDLVWKGTNDLSNLKYTVYYSKTEITGFETQCEVKTKVVEGKQRITEECTITNEELLTQKINEGTIAKSSNRETIASDRVIKATNSGTIEYYYIIVEYQDNGNQNDDLNGSFTGKIHAEAGTNTGDVNIMAIYTREDEDGAWTSRDTVPSASENYKIHSDSSCGGSEVIKYANGKVNILGVVNKGTVCNLYFEKIATISDIIATADNISITTSAGFGVKEESSGGLYEFEGITEGSKTQFYRGTVTNNYVRLGKDEDNYTYWRIVRFDEEGNIRLIYDGTSAHDNGEVSDDRQIEKRIYHSTYSVEANVRWSNSEIKSYLEETWLTAFENKLSQKENNALTTGKFCSDISKGVDHNYGAAIRLGLGKVPTFRCDSGEITNSKVGMLSADEYSFAGGGGGSQLNTSFYLYTGKSWWTLSPCIWFEGIAHAMQVSRTEGLTSAWVSSDFGIRPVITLKSDTIFNSSTNGTKDNPYIIA